MTSERERLDITIDYYMGVTGELDKTAQALQEAMENYPEYIGGLAFVYGQQGQYEKATEITTQGMRLAPGLMSSYVTLANYGLALQRFDEARQIIHEAQARKMDGLVLRNALYALAFISSDSAAMAEQRQWFAGKPYENFGLGLASDTEAYGGHLVTARELTKWAVDSATRADAKENGAVCRQLLLSGKPLMATRRSAAIGSRDFEAGSNE